MPGPLLGLTARAAASYLGKKAAKKLANKKIKEKQTRTMTQYENTPSGKEAAVQNLVRLRKQREALKSKPASNPGGSKAARKARAKNEKSSGRYGRRKSD